MSCCNSALHACSKVAIRFDEILGPALWMVYMEDVSGCMIKSDAVPFCDVG
jgi:hypothetical protein